MGGMKSGRAVFVALVVLASPLASAASDTPEEVYAKFHAATLAGDFDEMKKYGTADKGAELASMPAMMRQMMLGFMRTALPKNYSVDGKTIQPDGNRATLQVSATQPATSGKTLEKITGKVTLVKEGGEWKVDTEEWGGAPSSESAAAPKPQPKVQASLAPIPSAPAQGEVNGARFVVERAFVEQDDILVLRQGADFWADVEFVIFMFLDTGRKLDGSKFNVTSESGFGSPHIHLRYKVPGKTLPETQIFTDGYEMRLEFAKQTGKSIKGRIHLQLPTKLKTQLSGSFEAEIK